jgi:citrate/tricarballylate utilization protein
MSASEPAAVTAVRSDGRISLEVLVDEATRQLNICNACRYCEGLCAVFPALERRTLLGTGDVSQLANLCHDCRACYDACMYTTPHEFDLNVPRVLSAVRVADWQRYVWPARVPRALTGWAGIVSAAACSSILMLAIAVANVGWSGLVTSTDRAESPYVFIPYPVLLALMLAASLYAAAVAVVAARRYWKAVSGSPSPIRLGAITRAVGYAATMRYLRGGGAACYYPDDAKPSGKRRSLHAMTAYGFGLCIVSTLAAGALQDIAGQSPPYPWLSVPVISGTVGGVAILIGCVGLLILKVQSSAVTSFAQMTIKDYGLLTALTFLSLSGLATLLTRSTAAFGIVLLIHLSSVLLAFAFAPYSKIMHIIFRFLAIVRDNAESGAREALKVING